MNFKLKNTNLSPTQIVSSDTSQKAIFNSDTIQNIPIESDKTQLFDNMTLVYNSNDNKWIYSSLPFNSYVGQVYVYNGAYSYTINPNVYYNINLSSNMILSNFSNGYTIIDNDLACIKYEGNLNNRISMYTITCQINSQQFNDLEYIYLSVVKNPSFNENGEVQTGTYIGETVFNMSNTNNRIQDLLFSTSFITNETYNDEYYLVYKLTNVPNLPLTFIRITWECS